MQLKQGKPLQWLRNTQMQTTKTDVRRLVFVCSSLQGQTMARSQKKHGSTCWVFMVEVLRLLLDRQWPRLTRTAFTEKGKSRQRPEHFEDKRRGWNFYFLENTAQCLYNQSVTVIPYKNPHILLHIHRCIQSHLNPLLANV